MSESVSSPETHPLERRVAAAARERDATLDPEDRGRHGVVHTPAPLCRYVLRRADHALRSCGIATGITDPRLTLVDPAAGPGAFLASALALGARGRLLGFERDPAAAAAARSALGAQVEIRVGDTLAALPEVEGPVLVVGNPPWVGGWAKNVAERSSSDRLLADFRIDIEGEPLGERKIGVLSDAYVRFLRWSAEVVHRAGRGALGLVTNASFLDGPVHRGVRGFFVRRFDTVEITDLGGSALVARSGERDENVFGVRPAVAVTVAAVADAAQHATSIPSSPTIGTVSYARLRGERAAKLDALGADRIERVALSPQRPQVFFVPTGRSFPEGWLSLPELFPFHREGIQTNRDAVAIDADRERLLGRMQAFALGLRRPDLAKAEQRRSHYDPEAAREVVRHALAEDPEGTGFLRPLAYRPFDRRWYVDRAPLCHRPRPDLAAAIAHGGWALLSVRKDRGERRWNHVAAAEVIADNCFFSSRSSCRTRIFPRHDPDGDLNVSEAARVHFPDPCQAFPYALAVLAAAPYRAPYDDVLRRGYPRVPPPTRKGLEALVPLGEALAAAFVTDDAAAETPSTIGHRTVTGPATLVAIRERIDAVVGGFLEG